MDGHRVEGSFGARAARGVGGADGAEKVEAQNQRVLPSDSVRQRGSLGHDQEERSPVAGPQLDRRRVGIAVRRTAIGTPDRAAHPRILESRIGLAEPTT